MKIREFFSIYGMLSEPLSLPDIRLYVLERMLLVWGLLGAPIVAIVAIDDIAAGRFGAATFYVSCYAAILFCLLPSLLPYFLRSTIPLLVLYVVGSFEIYHHGLNSSGSLFYFASIMFSCILIGAGAATVVTVTTLASLCGYSYIFAMGQPLATQYSSFFKFLHVECLPDVVSLSLLSAMAISFLSILLKNLEKSVQTSGEYLEEIARERNHLIQLIEERDQAETQLQQAQKMEAVGQLAGGIAHDFNNLLQVVTAHTEILLTNTTHGSQEQDHLQAVRKAADRAASLTRQMLAYSRQQVMAPKYLNLNTLVEEITGMLSRVIPENIRTHFVPADELGTVHADPVQLEQVLLNLSLNARDAMPDGGTLTLATENVDLDMDFVANHSEFAPGPFVRVCVVDTGIGMTEEQQVHVFEPFFTTKKLGEGTGLGLAMAYGIVKQHGGTMLVKSTPDSGSEFAIYLPRVAHAVSTTEKHVSAPAPQGSETILVAEDNEAVRSLLIVVLNNAGFTVLSAEDGEEALALFKEHKNDIDLLLFDVVMPRLGGREACESIRSFHPDMRVLFMSGYAPDGLNDRFEMGIKTAFIQKPYRTKQMLEKIREVLDN